MPKTSSVVLAGNTISITRNPTGSNVADLIDKNNVTNVSGVFNQKPSNGEISYSTASGNYTIGETITGGTSSATGIFTGYRGTAILILSKISGTFVSGEVLTGGTSATTSNSTSAVTPTSYDNEWIYPYKTMTVVQIESTDGSKMNIELQDVSNQATWNLGTLAALKAAIADINAFL